MHHVLNILAMTFIQGHTDLNHENNKCLIISENIQAMPIKFAVKIVRLKINMTIVSPMILTFTSQGHDLDVTSASQTWLLFNLQYLGQYLSYYIQTWHVGSLVDAIDAHARFDYIDLDARSQWLGKGKHFSVWPFFKLI